MNRDEYSHFDKKVIRIQSKISNVFYVMCKPYMNKLFNHRDFVIWNLDFGIYLVIVPWLLVIWKGFTVPASVAIILDCD